MPLPVPQDNERQKLQLIPVENAVPAIQIAAAPKQQFRRPIAQQIQEEDLFLKSQPKPQARPQPKPQPQIPLVVEELEEFEDELEDELEELLEEAPSTPQQPKAQPIQQQRPQPPPQPRRPIDGVFVISQQEDQPDSAASPSRHVPQTDYPRRFETFTPTASESTRQKSGDDIRVADKYTMYNDDGSITWGYQSEDGSFKEETVGIDCVTRGR